MSCLGAGQVWVNAMVTTVPIMWMLTLPLTLLHQPTPSASLCTSSSAQIYLIPDRWLRCMSRRGLLSCCLVMCVGTPLGRWALLRPSLWVVHGPVGWWCGLCLSPSSCPHQPLRLHVMYGDLSHYAPLFKWPLAGWQRWITAFQVRVCSLTCN